MSALKIEITVPTPASASSDYSAYCSVKNYSCSTCSAGIVADTGRTAMGCAGWPFKSDSSS